MICGLIQPDSGSIHYFNSSWENIRLSQASIGYCPQHLSIWYDLTCHEQLVFLSKLYGIPKNKSKQQIEFLFENLHLTDKKNVPAGKLSGGMQQSLNLAMAMINDPDILILDEPFTGLDIQVRFHIRQMLRSFAHNQGKALILSTHNIDEAEKLADRIIIMDRGAIHESDTPEMFKTNANGEFVIEMVLKEATKKQIDTAQNSILKVSSNVVYLQETLLVYTRDKENTLEKTMRILEQLALKPIGINVRNRSLEDLFIELTGRRLN